MSLSNSMLDDLAEKAIRHQDAAAHQELTGLGYELQSESVFQTLEGEKRIGWYWGTGLLSGKSKSFYYDRPWK